VRIVLTARNLKNMKFSKMACYESIMETTKGMTEDDLFHMLNAYVLGDGGVYTQKTSKNSYFEFNRTAAHDFNFFKVAAIIEAITPGVNISLIQAKNYTTSGGVNLNIKESWRLKSPASPIYTLLRDAFYPKGVKTVPQEVAKQLDIRSIASLYVDDGSLNKKSGSVILCTDGFVLEDVQLLQQAFVEVTGLPWSLKAYGGEENPLGYRKSDNGRIYRLNLPRKYTSEFFDQITPLVDVSFRYKVDRSMC